MEGAVLSGQSALGFNDHYPFFMWSQHNISHKPLPHICLTSRKKRTDEALLQQHTRWNNTAATIVVPKTRRGEHTPYQLRKQERDHVHSVL